MVNAAITDYAAGVIPGIEHFAIHGGCAVELRHYLAAAIGREVLIADTD